MAAISPPHPGVERIPVPAWSWGLLLLAMLGAYVMLQENGVILDQWMRVHEFFHDGRHALGFPCH